MIKAIVKWLAAVTGAEADIRKSEREFIGSQFLTLEDIERAVQGMMEPKPVSLFVPPHKLDEVIAEATRTGMSTDNIKPSMPLHMVKTEGD